MSLPSHLYSHKVMRASIQGILAFIGVVLLGAGLALLSGLLQGGEPGRSTALAMVRTLPEAPPPAPGGFERPRAHPAPDGPPLPGFRRNPPPLPRAERPPRGPEQSARLAVVIDDIGHALDVTERFLALDYPLTYSVLPDVPLARAAAARIHAAGREHLVHLPMQPFDYPAQEPGPHPLLLSQDLRETVRRLHEYLETLPQAVGASNHMGSAYTWDETRMEAVQTVLAERNLFFLNSRTSNTPVPQAVAQRWGYAYLQRDVFLDHDPDAQAIEQAWRQALRQARRHGQAVAIGHPYPQTWRMLQRNLPHLAEEGIELVPLSHLLGR